ncbi:MAG: efflux transporter periplasmic adaptor subunit [Bacteroidetes bacterium SW_9_63_38]|nr:MAG: efflux transporter periplasmic adaptor subunit [Bacteroidetes bacterium SW_9_63_38]
MNWKTTLLVCLDIFGAGAAVTVLIFSTEPTAQRSGATKQTAMLVEVTTVAPDTVRPTIEAMGTVRPAQEVVLSPQVDGKIVRRGDAFTPGGYVDQGETLLQIDPSDYRNTLQERQSALQQAQAELTLEQGQQAVAKQDYRQLGDTLSGANEALVLRKPQLESAKSEVEAARAAVEQAKLNLQRTTIEVPFDAHIVERSVNVGSQVAPGDELARLVGLETYWVEATVPMSKLRWLEMPTDGQQGARVRVRNRTAWPDSSYREGRLFRLVGSLEEDTRLARVLIEVPDPLARESDRPRLMLGAYVEARIRTKRLDDVVRLNRDYVRDNETVWLMENGALTIQDVNVVFEDATHAYIDRGIDEQARVVTTNLSTIRDGAPLRLKEITATDSIKRAGE